MDTKSAKTKLDHVINVARVEMYKPIQIAEVLRVARTSEEVDLANSETYRIKSRHWRNKVTLELFKKCSTSSARFQDDVWNDSAVPPAAMVSLGTANKANAVVEAYIYSSIIKKNEGLVTARTKVTSLKNVNEVKELLSAFDSRMLLNSADRFYEILATAVFKTELGQTSYTISVDRPSGSFRGLSVDNLVDLVATNPMPLVVDRLGHTNAADAGLDIWTNFGVVVNVKHRVLTPQLLTQIVDETPIGSLHIVCLSIDSTVEARIKKLQAAREKISITTRSDLMSSIETLLKEAVPSKAFIESLTKAFDREFPMAQTLGDFADSRGYSSIKLAGLWKRPDLDS